MPAKDLTAELIRQLRNFKNADIDLAIQKVWGAVRESSETLPRPRTQEFSALEQQLRAINQQIESLKQPCGLDRAVDTLVAVRGAEGVPDLVTAPAWRHLLGTAGAPANLTSDPR